MTGPAAVWGEQSRRLQALRLRFRLLGQKERLQYRSAPAQQEHYFEQVRSEARACCSRAGLWTYRDSPGVQLVVVLNSAQAALQESEPEQEAAP